MIVEGAFTKLPEILETMAGGRHLYEPMVVQAMATGVFLELNARNIPHPSQHVTLEKPFADLPKGKPPQVDLFVSLEGALPSDRLEGYGCRAENWVEVKAYVASTRRSGPARRRPEEVGGLTRDLLRLCLLPDEYQGRIRKNARYFLVVHSSDPREYWGQTDDRRWVADMLIPGPHDLVVPLEHMGRGAIRCIGGGMTSKALQDLWLAVDTMVFSPQWSVNVGLSRYWGALVRIRRFHVSGTGWEVRFEDMGRSLWTAEANEQLERGRRSLIDAMRRNGRSACPA